jgi:Ca2+/Na+ antiporter
MDHMANPLLASTIVFFTVIVVTLVFPDCETRAERLGFGANIAGLVVVAGAVGIPALSQTTAQAVALWGGTTVAIGTLCSVRGWFRNENRAPQ